MTTIFITRWFHESDDHFRATYFVTREAAVSLAEELLDTPYVDSIIVIEAQYQIEIAPAAFCMIKNEQVPVINIHTTTWDEDNG